MLQLQMSKKIKSQNIKNNFIGSFFCVASASLLIFFLPFFLKEKGLSVLEIGVIFTIGIAIGSLLFSVGFSKILKKIRLKNALFISSTLNFLKTFVMFLFPTAGGAIAYKAIQESHMPISRISDDVTIQHNLEKKDSKKISSMLAIIDSGSIILGIILSLVLITYLGFKYSFLIFSLLTIPSFFFYKKINEKTRFKPKKKIKLPKISKVLKLFLFSELIYWLALSSSFALVITFLVTEKFGSSIEWIGILFIALYSTMMLTTTLAKKKMERNNVIKSSIFGMVLLLGSAIVIIISENIYTILGAFILEGIGAGIWTPSKTAIQWKLTKKENREKVSGWLSGLRSFVSALGPLLGGVLMTFLSPVAPFYFKAGIGMIIIGIYIYILRKHPFN